jgi:NAD(P)-dependent dehydrogenase (short-subunit alcohol dehydrogenase family)
MADTILHGLTAAIIGGSGGIGKAIAQGMAQAGAGIVILGRNPEKLGRAVEDLRADNSQAQAYSVDVTDTVQFQAVVSRIEAEIGAVDILVNSQGVTDIRQATEVSIADFSAIIATNLISVFAACRLFGVGMIARGRGCIINIASLAGHRGWPRAVAYSASKHGVVGVTLSLAAEWASLGVRVNAISPGFFMTDLNREKMPPERKEAALRRTPMAASASCRSWRRRRSISPRPAPAS